MNDSFHFGVSVLKITLLVFLLGLVLPEGFPTIISQNGSLDPPISAIFTSDASTKSTRKRPVCLFGVYSVRCKESSG